jgi:hypothetical protein
VIQDRDKEAVPASSIPLHGLPVLRDHLYFDCEYGSQSDRAREMDLK